MSAADLERTRFAYSPLVEAAESLCLLSAGRSPSLHRPWFDETRRRLGQVDMELLCAVVPARPILPDVLFVGAVDASTTIDSQLQLVADYPGEQLRADLEAVWEGEEVPAPARNLIADGSGGCRRLADALFQYWSVAIEPHWRQVRAVLDADVAYRANRLTRGGLGTMFADLHRDLSVQGQAIRINRPHSVDHNLDGAGLVLVPSVFVWPNLVVATAADTQPSITYAARGVGRLWGTDDQPTELDDALGALLGRSRAAILACLALPLSTSELGLELGQSAPAVSHHLSVLRRSGLVTAWRSGRRVLYRRTPLATSIITASGPALNNGSAKPA